MGELLFGQPVSFGRLPWTMDADGESVHVSRTIEGVTLYVYRKVDLSRSLTVIAAVTVDDINKHIQELLAQTHSHILVEGNLKKEVSARSLTRNGAILNTHVGRSSDREYG